MELLRNRAGSMPAQTTLRHSRCDYPDWDTIPSVLTAASRLRECGIRTRTDTSGRKASQIAGEYSAKGIRYALLIGESEAALGQVRLKDMAEQTEFVVPIEEAVSLILTGKVGPKCAVIRESSYNLTL